MVSLSKKVCLLGDFAVGKTSLVRRFVYNLFDDRYLSTIGVKVSRKVLVVPRDGEVVELTIMLWDLAGSEEFDEVHTSYLRGAAGAVLVCDVTRDETVTDLHRYARDLAAISPQTCLVVSANKVDLMHPRGAIEDRGRAIADALQAPCFLTSARTGEGVEDVFRHLARLLVR